MGAEMRIFDVKEAIGKTVDAAGLSDESIVIGFTDGTFIAARAELDSDDSACIEAEGGIGDSVMDFLSPIEAHAGHFISDAVYQQMMFKKKEEERQRIAKEIERLKAQAARLEAQIGGAA